MKTGSHKQIILVVDDTPANIEVAHHTLKDTYIVKVATSGARALDLAKLVPHPDLILLDVVMPGMDGYEVCSPLKSSRLTGAASPGGVGLTEQRSASLRGFAISPRGAVELKGKGSVRMVEVTAAAENAARA